MLPSSLAGCSKKGPFGDPVDPKDQPIQPLDHL